MAIAGIIGSLTAVPALIIAMNALKISERQRADALRISSEQRAEAQRVRADADSANQRAFIQRITVESKPWNVGALPNGDGTIVISNGNTTRTYVELRGDIFLDAEQQYLTAEFTARFDAPACSQATYMINDAYRRALVIDHLRESEPLIEDFYVAVHNPLDRRLWHGREYPTPIEQDSDLWRHHYEPNGGSVPFEPAEKRALPGCV
ncbi:hypothetical protein [Nonomuraea basaltis]|uniref:hypothetical protein n=1 Tax=Nonomuraea basaltis TaxID=2495887 RepID=UPI00110C4FEC|nr:hypothetical protein [Nonomuraea basaltis]TMR88186.1 hypothetical protein EJK15_67655 [Nonomuraea basaltis]